MANEMLKHAVVVDHCIIHVERKNYLSNKHTMDFLPDRSFAVICLLASARRPRLSLAPSVHRHGGLFFPSARELIAQRLHAPVSVICERDTHRQRKNELRLRNVQGFNGGAGSSAPVPS